LEVPSPEAPNRKRKPKVPQRESSTGSRDAIKDIIKVNAITPYWNHGALGEVSAKAGHFTKAMEDRRKVLNVTLDWCHKDGRVVRIQGSS
jgi:hypothetical protein